MMILAPLMQKYNTKWMGENVKVQVNQNLQNKLTQYINVIYSCVTYVRFSEDLVQYISSCYLDFIISGTTKQ